MSRTTALAPAALGRAFENRPQQLLTELAAASGSGLDDVHVHHHGGEGPGRIPWRATQTRRPATAGRCWTLSPLLIRHGGPDAEWVDLYDDWSRAPEMSPAIRAVARANYRRLESWRRLPRRPLVTVNSLFMRDRFAALDPVLVPNGVDAGLATAPVGEGGTPQVILMGSFFPGRTDYELVSQVLHEPMIDSVVVIAADERITDLVTDLAPTLRARVTCIDKAPLGSLTGWFTPTSVLLIPHVVSAYTMSQDPMKAYQAAALGIRTVLPHALALPHLDLDLQLVLTPDTPLATVLDGALRMPALDDDARARVVSSHSWAARAAVVEEVLDGRR